MFAHDGKLVVGQFAGFVQYLVRNQHFADIVQHGAHHRLVHGVAVEFHIAGKDTHQYRQVDRVLQQVVVFLANAAQAGEGIVIAQHRIHHAVGQPVERLNINTFAGFHITEDVGHQIFGFVVQFAGFTQFFLRRHSGLAVGCQLLSGLIQRLLVVAVNLLLGNRVFNIGPA